MSPFDLNGEWILVLDPQTDPDKRIWSGRLESGPGTLTFTIVLTEDKEFSIAGPWMKFPSEDAVDQYMRDHLDELVEAARDA